MGIEAMAYGNGQAGRSEAKAVCDECGKEEHVLCAYVGKANARQPKVNQARSKVLTKGWSYVKNKLRCPSCEAKRNVVQMKPKEPTKRQRIEIFTLLAECYDLDAGCYKKGDTDEVLAECLGVLPGWVAEIRESEFGPAGSNEDIESLVKELETHAEAVKNAQRKVEEATKDLDKLKSATEDYSARLDKIRNAVGPRVLRAAGVK